MRARTCRRHVAAAVVGVGFGVIAAGSPAMAADRAYELVMPPGSSGKVIPGTGASTPDGNVVCFDAESAVAGAAVNGEIAPDGFCSWRTASGWETEWVTGPDVPDPAGGNGAQVYWVSPDGRRVVFATDKGIYPDFRGDPPGGTAPATPSSFLWEGGGMPRWLAPTPDPSLETNSAQGRYPLAASDDLRHGIFESGLRLVPEDTNTVTDIYEWTPDGIRLVSRDASGAAAGGTGALDEANGLAHPGTISRDGSRIFFHHRGPLLGGEPNIQNVFMLEGDQIRHVSPRRGGAVPARAVTFAGASDDGEIVYLQTIERMTPEPKLGGAALYRYDVASDTLSLVATDAAGGVTFLGVSADGSTLVYRTGGLALRILRDGVATTLGELDAMDIDYYGAASPTSFARALSIAADGSSVVFSSLGSFDRTPSGLRQVYRWTPEEGVRRISAPADGAPPASGASIGNFSYGSDITPRYAGLSNSLRNYPLLGRVAADGGRVFFESAEQLAPADVNDYIDVYEWQDGTVRLISPGTQRTHALYHDNSADGNTVFFTTSARLIPELDRNTVSDLYAARVGGGFPLPERVAACEGDRCQGPLLPPTSSQPPGTTVFDGPGDAQDAVPVVPRHSVLRITAKQRRSFARSGRIVLRVRASAKGAVTATASMRVGRRTVRVARSVAAVRSGATVRVSLSLSRQARNVLRTKRKLRVVISVSYSESETSVRRVVMLRG